MVLQHQINLKVTLAVAKVDLEMKKWAARGKKMEMGPEIYDALAAKERKKAEVSSSLTTKSLNVLFIYTCRFNLLGSLL
jgi:hypothetical protein